MEPRALALLTQNATPLQLHFMADPVQLLLAMMQPEVLVEALKHRPQTLLLIASSPVHMPDQPLVGASKELAATLNAGDADHGELAASIHSADMLEAQKLKGLRPSTARRTPLGGESAKEQQPSFLLGQLQVESCEALPQLPVKLFRVRQVLES